MQHATAVQPRRHKRAGVTIAADCDLSALRTSSADPVTEAVPAEARLPVARPAGEDGLLPFRHSSRSQSRAVQSHPKCCPPSRKHARRSVALRSAVRRIVPPILWLRGAQIVTPLLNTSLTSASKGMPLRASKAGATSGIGGLHSLLPQHGGVAMAHFVHSL